MTDKQFKYLVKLVVVCSVLSGGLSMIGGMINLQIHLSQMDKSTKRMLEWSKKADYANEVLNEMFKVQRLKESYEAQGIGAKEDTITIPTKGGNNENNN